jgi:hypothetical protein
MLHERSRIDWRGTLIQINAPRAEISRPLIADIGPQLIYVNAGVAAPSNMPASPLEDGREIRSSIEVRHFWLSFHRKTLAPKVGRRDPCPHMNAASSVRIINP